MVFLFFLLLALRIILESRAVQNWLVDKVAGYLSEQLDTRVEVDRVDFALFSDLLLDGLYIEDTRGDTLLFAARARARFHSGIMGFVTQDISVKSLDFYNTQFNYYQDTLYPQGNAKFLMDYFKKENKDSTNKTARPLLLDAERVGFRNVVVRQDNRITDLKLEIRLGTGQLYGMDFDSETKHLSLEEINFDDLHFHIYKGDEREVPLEPYVPIRLRLPDYDSTHVFFTASAKRVQLTRGHFQHVNTIMLPDRPIYDNTVDFSDLDVDDISFLVEDFEFREDLLFRGNIRQMYAEERSGFVLEDARCPDVEVYQTGLHLNGVELRTPTSFLSDTISMSYKRYGYPSFFTFVDDVKINSHFSEESKLSIEDILAFVPELETNSFFRNNRNEVLRAKGDIKGPINRLSAKDFTLRVGNDLMMRGNFRSRNLAVRGEEFLDLELDRLRTSMSAVRSLVSEFRPPEQFDKLGRLDFKGRFSGFFTDFVADGYLSTALGDIRSDMNLKGNRENAQYSGNLDLINFDLAAWTENPDFGKVNFTSNVQNGTGLTASTVKATLTAGVKSLTFKGYRYEGLNVKGEFDKQKFDGSLRIQDDNIDLDFKGLVDLNDKIPRFKFAAKVNKLLLHRLNLSKKAISVRADLDLNFKGLTIADLEGSASAERVAFSLDSLDFELDSLYAYSKALPNGDTEMGFKSDVLTGELIGNFKINEVPDALISYTLRNFPLLSKELGLKPPKREISRNQHFEFDFSIPNTKNFSKLIHPDLDTLFTTAIAGYFDARTDWLHLDLDIGQVSYQELDFSDISVQSYLKGGTGELNIGAYSTIIRDSILIPTTAIYTEVDNEVLKFTINAANFEQALDNLNLSGELTLEENNFHITFDSSALVIYNQHWEIPRNNHIIVRKDFIQTKDFRLNNMGVPGQYIDLNSLPSNRGLSLSLNKFDVSFGNPFINYDKLRFGGYTSLLVEVEDIFKQERLRAFAFMDSLFINDDYFGELKVEVESPNIQSSVKLKGELTKKTTGESVAFKGFYRPPFLKTRKNLFNIDINIKDYPLEVSDYFIGELVSGTTGKATAHLNLRGIPSRPQLRGVAYVKDASTTVDYLQASLHVPQDTVYISPYLFDFSGVTIYDKEGNPAYARGGITHDHFRNPGLDLELRSPRFVAMDTKKEDNSTFYGKGVGEIRRARFSGDFVNTNIDVEAITNEDTRIFLPISYDRSETELGFIHFNASDSTETTIAPYEIKGLNFNMNVTIKPESEIQIIFDEQAGDILRGKGAGNIELNITREGDFEMHGKYTVERGDYLFTLLNVVNKPFAIKKGGTITWTGDPYTADIDLEARYDKLSATPYNFILEYLTDEGEQKAARRSTPIDLSMYLKGELLEPDISFDINFPNLQGRIKNFVDSKLRIVREDKNELNRQVLGLIAFGSFFPSDAAGGTSPLLEGSVNTLSEMLSSQLSIYVSELLSEVITDVNFDINYRYHDVATEFDLSEGNSLRGGSEVEIRFSKGLFNNRLTINAGSNIQVASESGAFLAGDLLIEYLLTQDGRFKLRFYQQTDQSITGDRENRVGLGVSYRREFDSLKELFGRKRREKMTKRYNDPYEFIDELQQTAAKAIEVQTQ